MNASTNKFVLGGIAAALILAFAIGSRLYEPAPEAPPPASPPPAGAEPPQLIREYSPTIGPTEAPVTVVEFLDPECESCAAMHPIVKNVMREFEGAGGFAGAGHAVEEDAAEVGVRGEGGGGLGQRGDAADEEIGGRWKVSESGTNAAEFGEFSFGRLQREGRGGGAEQGGRRDGERHVVRVGERLGHGALEGAGASVTWTWLQPLVMGLPDFALRGVPPTFWLAALILPSGVSRTST